LDREISAAANPATAEPAPEAFAIASAQHDVFVNHADHVPTRMLHPITNNHSEQRVRRVLGRHGNDVQRHTGVDAQRRRLLCGVQHHACLLRVSLWFDSDVFADDRNRIRCRCVDGVDMGCYARDCTVSICRGVWRHAARRFFHELLVRGYGFAATVASTTESATTQPAAAIASFWNDEFATAKPAAAVAARNNNPTTPRTAARAWWRGDE
jgi:hypothetical protein